MHGFRRLQFRTPIPSTSTPTRFERWCSLVGLIGVLLAPASATAGRFEPVESESDGTVETFVFREHVQTAGRPKRVTYSAQTRATSGVCRMSHSAPTGQTAVHRVHAHRMRNLINGIGTPLLI